MRQPWNRIIDELGLPPDLKKPIPASHWTGNGIPGDVPWTAEAGGRSGVWGCPPQAYGKFATATWDPPPGAIVRRPPGRPLDKEGGRGFADKCTAQGSDGGVFGAARAVGSFRNVDFLATGAGNWCGLLGMPSSCELGGCHEWVGLGSTDRSKRAWVHPGWPAGPASDARVFAFWGVARGTSGGVGTPASPGGQPGATGEVLWGAAADDGMGARLLSDPPLAGRIREGVSLRSASRGKILRLQVHHEAPGRVGFGGISGAYASALGSSYGVGA